MKTLGYNYALCVSLTLMLFFAFRFICGTLPKRSSFITYKQSRTLMGIALLVLSVNYSIHLFISPRFFDVERAIYMNLVTYFLSVFFFGSGMMHLMEKGYVTKKRFIRHLTAWVIYAGVFWVIGRMFPTGQPHFIALIVMSLTYLIYASMTALRIFLALRRLHKTLDSYHSDDVYAYVKWMSVITYWAISFGVGQAFFTFIPNDYIVYWIISAIPFYIYLYTSYKNYVVFHEKLSLVSEAASDTIVEEPDTPLAFAQENMIGQRLEKWIEEKKFVVKGLTIVDLSRDLCTNRTYLSTYINNHYNVSFREWINSLRLNYAKQLLLDNPELTITDVADRVGYVSLSYFTKMFTVMEGITPGKWRKLR